MARDTLLSGHCFTQQHWSDDEIVEIAGVIAVFGFLNRFNDTMATPLEAEAIGDAQRLIERGRWSPGKHVSAASQLG